MTFQTLDKKKIISLVDLKPNFILHYPGCHLTSRLMLEVLGLFFDSLATCTILPMLELKVPTNTSALERRSMSEKRYTNDLYS